MKFNSFSLRRNVIMAGAVLLSVGLFSACKKDNGSNENIPAAGLMAFNLSTDKQTVNLTLSGNQLLNTPLGYTNYSGGYANIYTGERAVKSYGSQSDSALATTNFNFELNKYYSVFVVGNNGVYKNVIVRDDFDSLSSTSGKAYVRYINAIPDSTQPVVTITATGANVVSNSAAFGTVSSFNEVTAGSINIAAAGDDNIAASRTITVESGKAYTILLVGMPGATDGEKAVQIKYIQNAG